MRLFVIIFFALFSFSLSAQSEQLARNYAQQGAYEKSLSIYQKLYKKYPNRINYLLGLVESYQQLEQFDKAEEILLKQIERNPHSPALYVELGHLHEIRNDKEKAKLNYSKAITVFEHNPNQAYQLGQVFEKYNLLDQAATVYEKGMIANPNANFNVQLAKIYGEQGNLEKMFDSYLELIQKQPNYTNLAERGFGEFITEDRLNEANVIFRKLLLKKLQQNPDILFNRLLSWLFVQQKDFKKAFAQEKAIYRRNEDNGLQRIINLALVAVDEKKFTASEEILNYIIASPSTEDVNITAYKILLKIQTENATQKDFDNVNKQYENLFDTYGKGSETIGLQIDYAHFLAFEQDKKQEAVKFLKRLAKERLSRFQSSRVKMKIADVLVLDKKFNQALIYYSQIQNAIKNNFLAQEARFKIAKTSYYKGDFDWAQTQLNVLKSSTSQLISNDAMELSLIISDNSLEDSTQTALKIFANADLLAFQKKNKEAISTYGKILSEHRGEKIEDEALLRQAMLYEKSGEFEKAKVNYLKIIEFYTEDILIDDAYFRVAQIFEKELQNPAKAKEYYERLIFDHADSIYYVEARKKYRALRGDAIN